MALKFEGCVWFLSVFVRLLWTFAPQTGYIHPDEFFQGPEITAGDVFELKTVRAWEFNDTFPVRSVVFPYLLTAAPFWITKTIMGNSFVVTARYLVVLPRLSFAVFSLIIDLSTHFICRKLHVDPVSRLCVVGTSFVTLVFYSRPFSNSVESVLFASLLAIIICSIFGESLAPTGWSRLRAFVTGLVLAAGVWNRPTFLVFSIVPLLGWLYNVFCRRWAYSTGRQFVIRLVKDLMLIGFGGLTAGSIFTVADSFYFGYLQKGTFVLTPLNFLLYNLDTSSLQEHGLHPRFMHFLVNMPLLFGPLAFIVVFFIIALSVKRDFLKCLLAFSVISPCPAKLDDDKKKAKHLIHNNTNVPTYLILLCSVLVPIGLLSAIPHQEPRFIIPVLVPLAILFSPLLVASPFGKLSWTCWNVLGCLLFGVLHQGGLYPSLVHLQHYLTTEVQSPSAQTSFHLVFYKTYMPPQHLLAWPLCDKGSQCKISRHNLTVHDLGGSPRSVLVDKLNDIIGLEKEQSKLQKRFEVGVK